MCYLLAVVFSVRGSLRKLKSSKDKKMKIRRLLHLAGFALCGVFASSPASAVVVDYSGFNINMGNVAIGQTGTIDADHLGNLIVNRITGTLPSNSMITFSYNFAGDIDWGALLSGVGYSYTDAGHNYAGYSIEIPPGPVSFSYGEVDGFPSTALAVASAQIDFSNNKASVIIKNFSSGVANYVSLFLGSVLRNQDLEIAYAVSAVPLPAALPMFALGLGALVGLGARRKRKADLTGAVAA
jgi:hypothetical protein